MQNEVLQTNASNISQRENYLFLLDEFFTVLNVRNIPGVGRQPAFKKVCKH
jgi:hypothetical protein